MAFSIRLRTARRISSGRHETGARGMRASQVDGLAHLFQIGADAFDQRGQIDLAPLLPTGAARGTQDGLGQGLQFFEVLLDPLLHLFVGDEFGADAHGRDRRAQIVADGGEQLALAFQRARDLVGHRVEGLGGAANVVRTLLRARAARRRHARPHRRLPRASTAAARPAARQSRRGRGRQHRHQGRKQKLRGPGFRPRAGRTVVTSSVPRTTGSVISTIVVDGAVPRCGGRAIPGVRADSSRRTLTGSFLPLRRQHRAHPRRQRRLLGVHRLVVPACRISDGSARAPNSSCGRRLRARVGNAGQQAWLRKPRDRAAAPSARFRSSARGSP